MKKTALILMDMQRGFMNEHTRFLEEKIAKHIVTKNYDFIIFTKFVNDPSGTFAKKLKLKRCMTPEDCELSEMLQEASKDHFVFEKETYSIFKNESFRKFLKEKGIIKLFFCGVDLDACVLASAFEAFDLGYDYEVLQDLCASSGGKESLIAGCACVKRNLFIAKSDMELNSRK